MLKTHRKYMNLPAYSKHHLKKKGEIEEVGKTDHAISAGNSIIDLPKNVERIPYQDTEAE